MKEKCVLFCMWILYVLHVLREKVLPPRSRSRVEVIATNRKLSWELERVFERTVRQMDSALGLRINVSVIVQWSLPVEDGYAPRQVGHREDGTLIVRIGLYGGESAYGLEYLQSVLADALYLGVCYPDQVETNRNQVVKEEERSVAALRSGGREPSEAVPPNGGAVPHSSNDDTTKDDVCKEPEGASEPKAPLEFVNARRADPKAADVGESADKDEPQSYGNPYGSEADVRMVRTPTGELVPEEYLPPEQRGGAA